VQPLTALTKKTQQWKWTTPEHTAFETLKVAYASKPVLMVADYDKAFEIEADASLFATGAVLLQRDTNGEQHPVAYYSKALTAPERNYQTYDCEFLAIIRALREWRHYVQGSSFKTIVHTDHHNLTYFQSPQKLTRRQVRWVVELMEYDVVLRHRAGKKMVVADALSRRADWSKGVDEDNEDVTSVSSDLGLISGHSKGL